MWCGIKKSYKTNKYRVIIPMSEEFINENMEITNKDVEGKVLTKWLDKKTAKIACEQFNALHTIYN